jgi:hypothetical protein
MKRPRIPKKVVLLIAVGLCAWLAKAGLDGWRQREIVRWVRSRGGSVGYSEPALIRMTSNDVTQEMMRAVVRTIGEDYLQPVVRVSLSRRNLRDISMLEGLDDLRILRIQQCRVESLTPLSSMTELEELHLDGNNVRDISPLYSLANLKVLSANGNQISDVSPLVGLKQLEYVELGNNYVPLDDIKALQTSLPGCHIPQAVTP